MAAAVLLSLSLCCFTAVVASGPQPPRTYHATGTIYLPKADVAEPYEAWVNLDEGMSRIDYYDGTVSFS